MGQFKLRGHLQIKFPVFKLLTWFNLIHNVVRATENVASLNKNTETETQASSFRPTSTHCDSLLPPIHQSQNPKSSS